jgi:DNA-binding response OmpR family regulator
MKGCRVLLVDDEQEFVSTLAERLSLRGLEVSVANSGEDAVRSITESTPDVVVLDLMMPGMSGLEVLSRMKSAYPAVQVILLTGMGSTGEGLKGLQMGAFDYLMKPLDIDALIKKIGESLTATACEVD